MVSWVRFPDAEQRSFNGGLVLIGNTPALQVGVRGSIPLSSTKFMQQWNGVGALWRCILVSRKGSSPLAAPFYAALADVVIAPV